MLEHKNDDGSPAEETSHSKATPKKSKSHASVKSKRTFEQALSEVEGIVSKLEGGKLELAQSLDEYQRGIGTLKECYQLLESAERRITLLSGFDADGNPVTEPFEEASMTIQEKQTARSSRRSAAKPRVSLEGHQGGGTDDDDSQEALF
jgi:exodeoxyribonuclease VII small subunit